MTKHDEFISHDKSLLIAPAGFGKTHFLAECINHCPDNSKQLILTHTHAGIASIREKLNKLNIPKSKYNIETISGYFQKYVIAFEGNKLPSQGTNEYFPKVNELASLLFKNKNILNLIKNTYQGFFVDEYQDCSKIQHNILKEISRVIPIHILGDPLQGIFNFKDEPVDFETDLIDFQNRYELEIPWRWKKNNRNKLGEELKLYRSDIIQGIIDLSTSSEIELNITKTESNNLDYSAREIITELLKLNNLLVIHPVSTNKEPRIKFIQSFHNQLWLLESIDDKEFYSTAKLIDESVINEIERQLKSILECFFTKSSVGNWFNDKGFKRKKGEYDQIISENLKNTISGDFSINKLKNLIVNFKLITGVKCYKKELLSSLLSSFDIAFEENITLTESVIKQRNNVRKQGRKVFGKSIGTTLLTKGLEFDNVVILDAHKFKSKEHFYVAMTRASKRLIIFSKTNKLTFNN